MHSKFMYFYMVLCIVMVLGCSEQFSEISLWFSIKNSKKTKVLLNRTLCYLSQI